MNQQQSLMSSFLNAHHNQEQSMVASEESNNNNNNNNNSNNMSNNLFKFNSFSNTNNGYSKPWEMLNYQGSTPSNSNYGQDSLLGMAATLFSNNNNNNNNGASMGMPMNNQNSMLMSSFIPMQGMPQQSQQSSSRPEDIMNQVLSELSDDLFDGPSSSSLLAVTDDLFDMEPVPINEHRTNSTMYNNNTNVNMTSEQTRLAVLEDTLNQVLNGTGEDDFGLAPMPSMMNDNKRNYMNMDFMSMPMQSQQIMPPAKKQRVMPLSSSPEMVASIVSVSPTPVTSPSMAVVTNNNNNNIAENGGDMIDEDDEDAKNRFRPYQAEQWSEKFEELLQFKKDRGHCCVPHTFQENPSLARWVKRQRYQYKLKNEGKPSTMTDERVVALGQAGFVWDSHGAAWEERWNELSDYRIAHNHTNVPSNHPVNPQLATWVKCQRRQYKLFWDGKASNMTLERITKLESLGFEWELRGSNKKSASSSSSSSSEPSLLAF